jgi:hypothetical protein
VGSMTEESLGVTLFSVDLARLDKTWESEKSLPTLIKMILQQYLANGSSPLSIMGDLQPRGHPVHRLYSSLLMHGTSEPPFPAATHQRTKSESSDFDFLQEKNIQLYVTNAILDERSPNIT